MKVKIDIEGLTKKVEALKEKIYQGITEDGFQELAPDLEDLMTSYMKEKVYDVYEPVEYERTYNLLHSITSKINGNRLYIYSSGKGLEGMPLYNNASYNLRVLYGDDEYEYDYPKEGAAFMNERDWIEPTAKEIENHAKQQSGWIKIPFIKGIKKRIKEVK